MNRPARRAIFFDLDGILADSEGVSRQVFRTFAAAFGRAAESAEAAALDGSPAPILVAKAKRAWGLPQKLDELTRRYDGLMDAALLELPPAPAVAPLFAAASRNGWKLGILAATASARTRAWLVRHGLGQFVDIVVGGEEVCLGKPAPEPYLIALARSGCSRDLALAVEGSLAGARSALAAGLRTFGLAPTGQEPVAWPEPVRLIAALDELMPELDRPRLRGVRMLRHAQAGARALG
ncbi:MAG TPA: HAD family phosphatase [Stellaceae bacterium]|nr:HAD family phosphatase [Stellaceae bacterium]